MLIIENILEVKFFSATANADINYFEWIHKWVSARGTWKKYIPPFNIY